MKAIRFVELMVNVDYFAWDKYVIISIQVLRIRLIADMTSAIGSN